MKNVVNKILILMMLQIPFSVFAQINSGDDIFRQKFNSEVKQISQFIDRFNFSEPVQPTNNTPSRLLNLVSLLNLKDSSFVNNPATTSFLNEISGKSNFKISTNDSNWFAFVNSTFLYHKKETKIDVILKMVGTSKKGYQWIVVGAESRLFDFPVKNSSSNFINPMNHELDFTELSKALQESKSISFYCDNTFKPNAFSTFLFLVKNGDLKFKQINSSTFQFLQIPNWLFTIKNFNRTDNNSGWLISEIKSMTETDKVVYQKKYFTN